jgi:hypothetical protein
MTAQTFVVTPTLFRVLLVTSLVSGLIGGVLDLAVPGIVPEAFWQAQAEAAGEEFTPADIALLIGGLLVLVAALVSLYGLYLFRGWAPRLALAVSVGTVVLYPLGGVSVSSGWAGALMEISTMLWGAVLAFTYSAPLKDRFGGQSQPSG